MNKWRNTCPDELQIRIEEVAESRLYLLRQTGPTGFLLKEHDSNKKFKVLLGDIHSCNCFNFVKEKELCKHILWTLIKKFRLPKENPLVFQLGLCERELQNVLTGGHLQKTDATKIVKSESAGTNDKDSLKQKKIDQDDVCPICQDSLYDCHKNELIYCRFGCGNSVHINCMKIWADHQLKSSGKETIKCPLCRTEFSSHRWIVQEHLHLIARKKQLKKKMEITCSKCSEKSSLYQSYRCSSCSDIWLCSKCIHSHFHLVHPFEHRKSAKESWKYFDRSHPLVNLTPSIKTLDAFDKNDRLKEGHKGHVIRSAPSLRRLSRGLSTSESNLGNLCFGINGIQVVDTNSPKNMAFNKPPTKKSFLPPILSSPIGGLVCAPQISKNKRKLYSKLKAGAENTSNLQKSLLDDQLQTMFTISRCTTGE